ncbi:MAG: extracellular solute-binding protein [Lachnospiraceae bacterium]|nr:extracellular solute-binding protein [Lachnospiraceae bacterium]
MLSGLIWTALMDKAMKEVPEEPFAGRETIHLWYTDSALTDYLNSVSVAYNESQDRFRAEPSLRSGVEFLEEINRASVAGDEDFPDVYIIGNDQLGKAAMAGLASEVTDKASFADTVVFPLPAIRAVTWNGKIVAYPLYFETAALLYSSSYLKEMNEAASLSAQTVPSSITEIMTLADSYDAPEGLKQIFSWDVEEIFYNYYFVGSAIDVGGPCGDDVNTLDIYNADAIKALMSYQQLGQFFSIDSAADSYDSVLDDFIEGRIAFTVATTDACAKLKAAAESGRYAGSYGVSRLPDITDEIRAQGLSVTQCMAVNGYSKHMAEANAFINFVLFGHIDGFYDRTGKAPALNGYSYSDRHMDGFFQAYALSEPISKMRETENFWMLLENVLAEVWDGADPNAALKQLYEQTLTQITGTEGFVADPIANPPVETVFAGD